MSANTDIVEAVQRAIATELLPILKVAKTDTVDVGGESIEIPQPAKNRLKQRVQASVVDIKKQLNDISI